MGCLKFFCPRGRIVPGSLPEGVSFVEWENVIFLSFVGAMKIARNLAVSGRYNEWYAPLPAPSLRELARPKGVTEGVSFVEW